MVTETHNANDYYYRQQPHQTVSVLFDGDVPSAGVDLTDDVDGDSDTTAEPPPDFYSSYSSIPSPKAHPFSTYGALDSGGIYNAGRVKSAASLIDETEPLFAYARRNTMPDVEKGNHGGYHRVSEDDDGSAITSPHQEVAHEPTVFSCSVNLINTILGTCMMSMPYAFARVGLLPGVGCLFLAACVTWFSLRILVASAIASSFNRPIGGNHPFYFTPPSAPSYADLARASMRGAFSPVIVETLVVLSCLGFSTSYLAAIGESMPGLITAIAPEVETSTGWVSSLMRNTWFWMFVALFVLVPLSLSRDVDEIPWFNSTALGCALYLAGVVIVKFIFDGGQSSMDPIAESDKWQWISYGGKIGEIMPVFVFAFTCHQNIFSIYNELVAASARKAVNKKHRSNGATLKDIYVIIDVSVAACALTYFLVGTAGYITFGSKVNAILLEDYASSAPIVLARIAFILLAALSYPIYVHPCRASFEAILVAVCPWYGPSAVQPASEDAHRVAGRVRPGVMNRLRIHLLQLSARLYHITRTEWPARILTTLLIVFTTYACALGVRSLEDALTIVGATGGVIVCYVLPTVFFVAGTGIAAGIGRRSRKCDWWFAIAVALVGVFSGILSLVDVYAG